MSEQHNFNVEVQPIVSPACRNDCLEAGVARIVSSFVTLAKESNELSGPDRQAPQNYDITCQVRCEGPESRGFFRSKACGMVASLQMFDIQEQVVIQGTFHNDA